MGSGSHRCSIDMPAHRSGGHPWFLMLIAVAALACADAPPCGDGRCAGDESLLNCSADCDFDLVVVVEAALYEPLESQLAAYVNGLRAQGFKASVLPFEDAPVEELRWLLMQQYVQHNIEGAFLIGDLPTAWYEQPAIGIEESFPMDLYLGDLDDVFKDTGGEETVFDAHEPIGLEIFISRVMGDATELETYLERVNEVRRKGPLLEPSALVFIDDEWSKGAGVYGLDQLYLDVELISDPSESTVDRYVRELTEGSAQFVLQMMHAGPDHLTFEGVGGGILWAEQIREYDFRCSIVHLWNCYAARFVEDPNLAMIYTVENTHGLAAIGSTTLGAVRRMGILHERIARGETLGEAFKYWYNTYGYSDDEWALGVVLIGDPMLTFWGGVIGTRRPGLSSVGESVNLEWMDRVIREQPTPPDLTTFDDYKRAHPEFFR